MRVETLPADELPEPVPAPAAKVPRGNPMFGPGNQFAKLGGLAKARKVRLIDSLGLAKIADDASFSPYRCAAEEFVSHHLAQLAMQAGGQVGAAPSTMIASAALQLAASRWCFDRGAQTGDVGWKTSGSKFANDSRQNLLAAYELAVREAKARAAGPRASAPWLEEATSLGSTSLGSSETSPAEMASETRSETSPHRSSEGSGT
ncbi:MAG: hypothetical protein ACLP7W_02565 [Solirubrobacteraceae bacterium]